jgi:hypothetical protein
VCARARVCVCVCVSLRVIQCNEQVERVHIKKERNKENKGILWLNNGRVANNKVLYDVNMHPSITDY